MKIKQFNNILHEKLRNFKIHKPKDYWKILNPKKHKKDHSTLVGVRKVLCKARYLNLILPKKTYLNLKGSDISEGNIFG